MGYDPNFIAGCHIPLPRLSDRLRCVAFGGGEPLEHTRFSVIFHQGRGFAIVTGHNIDGASIIEPGVIRRRNNFRLDPHVPADLQVDNDRAYSNNPWDRGHLVRRRALHWDDVDEARRADSESFFWTNIAPQHNRLNQTSWARVEDWVLELADENDDRTCVFTGPIFTDDDLVLQNRPGELAVHVPAGFWKILSIKHRGRLRAAGFLLWQRDFGAEQELDFDPVLEQVRITTLEYLTGLNFGDLRLADPLRFGADLEPVDGGRAVAAGSAMTRSAVITRGADILM